MADLLADVCTTSRDLQADFDSLRPGHGTDRRGFMTSSLAVGFAAAVSPVQAQSVITTDSAGLDAGEVKVPTADGTLPAYFAAPAGGKQLGTVIVVQEIFGVHEYIRDVCRRLAKTGLLAVAPELYARQGDPSKISDVPTLQREIVSKVPDAQVMADIDATVAWAVKRGGDPTRLGITGFCWGGRIVWLYAAHNPKLLAGVAWYGRLVGDTSPNTPQHPVDVAANIKAPILGLYGAQDAGISVASVDRMKTALGENTRSRFVVYPDAPHAFHADYRPSYRKQAADDGWQRLLAWFTANGVAP